MKRRDLDHSGAAGSQSEPDFIGDYPESYTVDTAAGQEKFQLAALFWGPFGFRVHTSLVASPAKAKGAGRLFPMPYAKDLSAA
jgi:hypothetical protein